MRRRRRGRSRSTQWCADSDADGFADAEPDGFADAEPDGFADADSDGSPTPSPTASPTPSPTASPTPSPTASPTPTPTASPRPTPSPTASPTPSPTELRRRRARPLSPTPSPTARRRRARPLRRLRLRRLRRRRARRLRRRRGPTATATATPTATPTGTPFPPTRSRCPFRARLARYWACSSASQTARARHVHARYRPRLRGVDQCAADQHWSNATFSVADVSDGTGRLANGAAHLTVAAPGPCDQRREPDAPVRSAQRGRQPADAADVQHLVRQRSRDDRVPAVDHCDRAAHRGRLHQDDRVHAVDHDTVS